jgi:hypothetical protein
MATPKMLLVASFFDCRQVSRRRFRLMINPSQYASILEMWCLSKPQLEKSMSSYRETKLSGCERGTVHGFQTGAMRYLALKLPNAAVSTQLSIYARVIARTTSLALHGTWLYDFVLLLLIPCLAKSTINQRPEPSRPCLPAPTQRSWV